MWVTNESMVILQTMEHEILILNFKHSHKPKKKRFLVDGGSGLSFRNHSRLRPIDLSQPPPPAPVTKAKCKRPPSNGTSRVPAAVPQGGGKHFLSTWNTTIKVKGGHGAKPLWAFCITLCIQRKLRGDPTNLPLGGWTSSTNQTSGPPEQKTKLWSNDKGGGVMQNGEDRVHSFQKSGLSWKHLNSKKKLQRHNPVLTKIIFHN